MIHGGAMATLADTVAGCCACSKGGNCVTASSSMEFLRPAQGDLFCEATPKKLGRQLVFDILTREDYDYLDNELSCYGHNMLGAPYFVQYDLRENPKYYDTVLLQLHSELGAEDDYMCWGDGGVANFFINSEALARRDFSRVLYCWDCD